MLRRFTVALLSILSLNFLGFEPVQAIRYVDTSDDWADYYITFLADSNIADLAADGRFNPDKPLTRIDLATWLVKAARLENDSLKSKPDLADVSQTDAQYKDVAIVIQNGYMAADGNYFHPQQSVSKLELIDALAKASKIKPLAGSAADKELSKYTDASQFPEPSRGLIAALSQAGLLPVKPGTNTLSIYSPAQRNESSLSIYMLRENIDSQYLAQGPNSKRYLAQQNSHNDKSNRSVEPDNNKTIAQTQATEPSLTGTGSDADTSDNDSSQTSTTYSAQQSPAKIPSYSRFTQPQFPKTQYPKTQYPVPTAYAPTPTPTPTPTPAPAPAPAFPNQGYSQYRPANSYPQASYPPAQNNSGFYRGHLVIVGAGTPFTAQLSSGINTATATAGETVLAVLNNPIYLNGIVVIPAGTQISGTITQVSPAKNFQAGAGGKIEMEFNRLTTPDGRIIPLQASVQETDFGLSGQGKGARIRRGLTITAAGAAAGALLGTAVGGVVAGSPDIRNGQAIGKGAIYGTTIGAGIGALVALTKKGNDLLIPSGTIIPLVLDQPLRINDTIANLP